MIKQGDDEAAEVATDNVVAGLASEPSIREMLNQIILTLGLLRQQMESVSRKQYAGEYIPVSPPMASSPWQQQYSTSDSTSAA